MSEIHLLTKGLGRQTRLHLPAFLPFCLYVLYLLKSSPNSDKDVTLWNTLKPLFYPTKVMALFLWTLQTIFICLPACWCTNHHKGRRDWGSLAKMFGASCQFPQILWNRPLIKLVGRRAIASWRWRSWYEGTIHQHSKATGGTAGDEVYNRGLSSSRITSPTFEPGEQEHSHCVWRQV